MKEERKGNSWTDDGGHCPQSMAPQGRGHMHISGLAEIPQIINRGVSQFEDRPLKKQREKKDEKEEGRLATRRRQA